MMNINPWTYAYIRQRADEATYEAKQLDLQPITVQNAMRNFYNTQRFNIPFLGDYIPDDWEATDTTIFVDTSNRQLHSNTVISKSEMYMRLKETYDRHETRVGLGVIEQGQFQVLVRIYRKKGDHDKKEARHKSRRDH